ncbi:MAG: YihY/virulence factor BrkB family protein [Gemmiger sp.]
MTQRDHPSRRGTVADAAGLLIRHFFAHGVSRSAAVLAYDLLFALFPLLILLNNVVGLLQLNVTAIAARLLRVLPREVVALAESYLEHISHTSRPALFWFSLVFTLWFPLRAAKELMDDVRLAYGLGRPARPLRYALRQLTYTVVLLVVLVLTPLFMVLGRQVLLAGLRLLPAGTVEVSAWVLRVWEYLRFLLAGLLMFGALGSLYQLSLDESQPVRAVLPGIAAALAAWMAVSVGFNYYVENFAHYSVVYGALGAVIVLLLWLYLTSLVLILGAELNAVLLAVRRQE